MISTPIPNWLSIITAESICQGALPLKELLADSLYYPAAGDDGRCIEMLSSYVQSFIHVDYSRTEGNIRTQMAGSPGFAGYDLLGLRPVSWQELIADNWRPAMYSKTGHRSRPTSAHPRNSFGLWGVYQRRSGYDAQHGAERFSLLHLHAEGVAAYDALYLGHNVQARFLAIVQPGEGFGDNWTRFTRASAPLHRLVTRNPIRLPEYLVFGGRGRMPLYQKQACWAEFPHLVSSQHFPGRIGGTSLTVWSSEVCPVTAEGAAITMQTVS